MKYQFNYKSLSFEEAKTTPGQWVQRVLIHSASGITFAVVVVFIWTFFFESPKEKQLSRKMQFYQTEVAEMQKQVDLLSQILKDFEEKDDNLYRIILDAEPLKRNSDKSGFEAQYNHRVGTNSEVVTQLQLKVNILTQRTQKQLNSYKELWLLAQEKESIQASIPAISPVKNPVIVSGFGMRYHPIYKILKRHTGIDIIGQHGTPIYATADGVVVEDASASYSGYGVIVVINHGRGYKTAYAHLSKKKVHIGQKVKRGEVIGYMGSTGLSVGTHLHYEVFKNGEFVNPIHYFFGDLTPEEYNAILEKASEVNQALS